MVVCACAFQGYKRPLLVDQAAGFRREAVVTLEDENAFRTGPTRSISPKTYMRLRWGKR
jgi:hypothetical protein